MTGVPCLECGGCLRRIFLAKRDEYLVRLHMHSRDTHELIEWVELLRRLPQKQPRHAP